MRRLLVAPLDVVRRKLVQETRIVAVVATLVAPGPRIVLGSTVG